MCKKGLIVLLSAMSCFVTSCVDKNYDLANKEISTDVKLEGNTIALPVGSLKPVLLDSLIDVNEIELLVKDANGVYAIKMEDSIAVNEEIEAITLDIAPFVYSYPVEDFGKVDINNVHIDKKSIQPEVKSPNISVADLNMYLPHLSDAFTTSIEIPGLESMLEQLDRIPGGKLTYELPQQISVNTGEKKEACKVEYKLPDEIETIKSIKLGSDADKNGTLVKVNVTSPNVLESCDKTLDIRVEFPENFILAKNYDAEGNYIIDGNKVTLTGFVPQADETVFSFYITDITDVDKYIDENGVISIDESISYSINYVVDGVLVLKKGMTMSDFAFDVNFDVELSFQDVAGKTKDVKVDFEGFDMEFSSMLTDLENISKVSYVEFDKESSFIEFKTTMDEDWFGAFELMDGYALKVSIPTELKINHELSDITGKDSKVIYNKVENAYYVKDLSILVNSNWKIALEKIDLNLDVKDGKCKLKKSAKIELVNLDNQSESGYFYFEGREMDSMVEILKNLSDAEDTVLFELLESELVIKNAVVNTTATTSSLNHEMTFDINEEIPGEIERIERIGFEEDVLITMTLDVEGLDGVESVMNFDFDMSLPSFLKLKSDDEASGVKIENGLLHVETEYNSSSTEPLQLKLLCSGFDFINDEFGPNGYVPQKGDDGKSYIKYSSDIFVDGKVVVQGTEFHSTMLKNDVSFNIEFDIADIVVESFHGLYSKEIPGIEEEIDFDLGEDLDFLKDASLTLADPQLELVLTNTVGVPVDVVLDIFGRNENGDVIESTIIGTTLTIAPAEYDDVEDRLAPVETRYLLTTTECEKVGYKNVKIENLGSLLAEMPNSLSLKVTPVIQTGVTHHVDVSQPIKLDAAYSVVIPFKFTELNFCYNDTITGLGSDLGETMEMFSNVSLSIKMDVINTIPIGLSLDITPLDVNGNEIKDIEIDELNVAVGSGEDLVDENGNVCATVEPQKFVFGIKSKKGDISSLDGLAFLLTAAADHTDGAAIKGEQGLKISNIVFEVSGDVEVDFGK